MSTTIRTELTAAGCNVATATVIFQNGVGWQPEIGTQPATNPSLNGQSTTGGTDKRLDALIPIRQDNQLPRVCAIDSNNIYVWHAAGQRRPKFRAIPITAAAYTTGNTPIPILAEF